MLGRRFAISAFSVFVFAAFVAGVSERLQAQPAVEANDFGGFVEPKHPHHHHFGGWYLGVYGNFTPGGLYLTQVYPGTAAWNVGLEVGDRILAVNGRRISMHYPLNVALQSTHSGWVQLWVRDWRTSRLLSVNVRLTRSRVHF
ncbi:PDZ domain (Also known as DHR or GLGF) [Stieleria neptunia]|uniref:PDZ domain (Also known as DHR or GLGF) n=1 Tax=Stieleria neptunia TaxID=2527979 RepID=A0A518HK04_9BACT|nr:PDZ domain-containing protein [Stieleria neptunia]QDV41163.1 PDZ domain (Also known as DHR or GLGF) [Stieleria neptunia]